MKKTYTITFHSPINNGSFLQAYALQRTLINQCGVENKIIDFQSDKQKKLYALFRPIKSKQDLIKNVISFVHFRKLNDRKRNFKAMQRKYLILTDEIATEDDVLKIASSVDINIVGSDQVWNSKALDFSPVYFLPKIKTKKISFAVSCGSHAQKELINDYIEYINDFSSISVREKSMVDILDFYNKDICISNDPTMLLGMDDYFVLFDKKPLIKGEYILLYSMSYSEEILKTAKSLSKKLNIPVITPFTTYSTIKCKKYGIKIKYDAAPDMFLNLIYNSKFVLTNSYHGTAFSIIFKKIFYHVCDRCADDTLKRDDRIDDLLDLLDLKRNISSKTSIDYIKNNLFINYENIEEKLNFLRKNSIDFLLKNLEN